MVGVHLEQAANTFFFTATGIEYVATCFQFTGINAEEAQTAYIGVCSDLERQSAKRFIGRNFTNNFCIRIIGQCSVNFFRIYRARQISTNGIQQRLNAFILKGRATSHREDVHRKGSLTDCTANFVFRKRRGIIEVLFHYFVIALSNRFQHLVTPFFGFRTKFSRNFLYIVVSAKVFGVPYDSFHGHQIDYSLEVFFRSDGDLDRTRICAQNFLHLAIYFKEVCSATVHFIYICQTRHMIFIGLAPNGFTLRFHTAYRTKSSNSSVQNTKRAFHFHGKVNVSRSVDQIDFVSLIVVFPESGSSSTGNSNTTFLFLRHPVHCGCTIVHFPYFMR